MCPSWAPYTLEIWQQRKSSGLYPIWWSWREKQCGKIKGRWCADGQSQRNFVSREDASSPITSLYAIMLFCLINAIEGRCVATTDISRIFLQMDMPEDEVDHIRIYGALAELMAKIDPDLYKQYLMSRRRGTKVFFAKTNKTIYGILQAALLFWQKLKGKLADGLQGEPIRRMYNERNHRRRTSYNCMVCQRFENFIQEGERCLINHMWSRSRIW